MCNNQDKQLSTLDSFRVYEQLDLLELSGSRGLPGLCFLDCLAFLDKVIKMYKTHSRLGEAVVHRIVLPNKARGRGTRFLRFLHTKVTQALN